MSALPILRARSRELRNGWRDGRRRAMLLFALAVNLALGIWGSDRLAPALDRWQASGELGRGLGLLCLAAWSATAAMGLFAVRDQGFGDRARLLFTLPVPPAARVRALAGLCALQLVSGFGVTLLFLLGTLARKLGIHALSWILLLLGGMGGALWAVLALQMAFTARRVAVFPLGRLYEAAFFAEEAGGSRARPRRLLRRLVRPLSRWRGPAGALLVREALIRGRHWLEWLRAGLFAAGLLLGFPALHRVLAARGLAGPLVLVGAVAATALFYVFDGSSSPLGAEGSRLLLFLTAPLGLGALLRAKLLVLLAPLLLGGSMAVAVLAALGGFSAAETGWTLAAAGLVLAGTAAVFSLGSAWDADLDVEIESGMRGYVQENAPMSATRMALFGLASLAVAAELWLLWRLAPVPGLLAVAACDGLLLAALSRPAASALRRLAR
jgi:hypothetical protein